METQNNGTAAQTASFTPSLKQCPFCDGQAEVIITYDPIRYGVMCVACRAHFLPNSEHVEMAVGAWNLRCGGPAAGGRATRGISTPKKRRASRNNLKAARIAKKVRKVMTETDHTVSLLKEARQMEIAQLEAAATEHRARLMTHESQILNDPALCKMYALLKHPKEMI